MSEQIYIERYWRDATPQDAIAEPPMVARFRDKWESDKDWVIGKLIYWDRSRVPWNGETWACFERCQVYDAPDPGEGWRLVDIDKDKPQFSDEYYLPGSKTWTPRDHIMPFNTEQSYRRRIEQPKPKYEPFRWEDREQLRGRWITITLSCGEVRECQIEFLRLERNVFYVGSFTSDQLLEKNARFLDTGEPVGKRVE